MISDGNRPRPMASSRGSSTARLAAPKISSTRAPNDIGSGCMANAERSASLSAWARSFPVGWSKKKGSGCST
jgi:hypothetical protein